MSTYVVAVDPDVRVATPTVKVELADLWSVNPIREGALSCQLRVTFAEDVVTKLAAPTKFVGAGGGSDATGVTLLEAADAAPVPIALVAVTVKV